jgi:tRNA (guanine-N7-)-methyltransferase
VSRKKLKRFLQNEASDNVLQVGKPLYQIIKGNWNSLLFKNQNPIVLELGCGKGEYTIGLAQQFPDKNFIGVDIKGDRLAVGSNRAQTDALFNVAFLRCNIADLLNFFHDGEISEIWITFPDPRPRERDIKRRLTAPRFLAIYQKVLRVGGALHLKTDNEEFFDFSLKTIQESCLFHEILFTKDLYASQLWQDHFGIKTRFEEIFTEKGFKINYLKCILYENMLGDEK